MSKSNNIPSLNLQLSIGGDDCAANGIGSSNEGGIEEQVRLAGIENVYAEKVRELARREMKMAEEDFTRAKMVLEIARQEVQNVERMKEMSVVRKISPTSAVITCRNCHQFFTS
ncbi:C2H2-like zinc fingerprotein [Zostera marina]|uniref:C2H2-like zinc fingerprotein n=1 Tax=Zostera marina TaxID=29655 RepID=A0A0K9PJ09_ZOSMR|nr:C2H2-like zinc fingerprotein [Zostera marina]